jgi:hypothetical protein
LILARLARSRIAVFALAGTGLFLVAPRESSSSRIELAMAGVSVASAATGTQRGVSSQATEENKQRTIEDEILYREALRLGLDQSDTTLKQHLIAKALLFAEDLSGASRTPTEPELRAYYERTRERWVVGTRTHFIHVYGKRRDSLITIAGDVREAEARAPGKPPPLGDAFAAVREMTATEAEAAAMFGDEFARSLLQVSVGIWSPPLESKFGWHLVKVLEIMPGHAASFDEVRSQLPLEWSVDERHKAIESFLRHAYSRYQVYVDGERVTTLTPTGRLGRRSQPSAED